MVTIHRPLLTQQPKVPYIWLILINSTWFTGLYTMFVSGTALPLTLRRFTDDTRLIGLLTSIGLWFGIVIGPLVNYTSDRIWSRFGRRRPFLIIAGCGTLLSMALIPFSTSLGMLVLLIVVSSILGDVGSTQEPLWLEVIPPDQRGRAISIRILVINLASMLFFQIMFAQYDEVYRIDGNFLWSAFELRGEQMCYLLAAALNVVNLILLSFVIREVRPPGVKLMSLREIQMNKLLEFITRMFAQPRWWDWVLLLAPLGFIIQLPATVSASHFGLRPWIYIPIPWTDLTLVVFVVPILLIYRLFRKVVGQSENRAWCYIIFFPYAFMAKLLRDVFCEKRWWWIYMFYTSGTFVGPGLSVFSTFLMVEQFGYSKANIAATGWPTIIVSNLVTFGMGWFADKLPKLNLLLMFIITVVASSATYYCYISIAAIDPLELPPFYQNLTLCILGTISGGTAVLMFFQILRNLSPNSNPRLWAWLLSTVNTVAIGATTYFCIKVVAHNGVPSMSLWFLIMCINSGSGCLNIIAGPLLYEYMPRDKIGTLSSGFGLINTALSATIQVAVGSWIYYYSKWFTDGTTKDYSSSYVLQMLLSIITFIFVGLFLYQAVKGRIIEYGRLGLNSTETPPPTS